MAGLVTCKVSLKAFDDDNEDVVKLMLDYELGGS